MVAAFTIWVLFRWDIVSSAWSAVDVVALTYFYATLLLQRATRPHVMPCDVNHLRIEQLAPRVAIALLGTILVQGLVFGFAPFDAPCFMFTSFSKAFCWIFTIELVREIVPHYKEISIKVY